MSKATKSKSDLEQMIRDRTRSMTLVDLIVQRDPKCGWRAVVKAAPEVLQEHQMKVDRLVADLRLLYDLKP